MVVTASQVVERYKNPLHHYHTNNQVAQYLNPGRATQDQKVPKRNHQREIRHALKEMQISARLKREEEAAPKPEAWKLAKFKQVPSKIKQLMEVKEAPPTPEPHKEFLKRGTLTKRVNEKAAEARARTATAPQTPVAGQTPREVPSVLSPRDLGPRKPSVPKASDVAHLAPRTNKNHIIENRKHAVHSHPPVHKEEEGPYRHKSFGEVPSYLQERKAEWADEEARRRAAMPDPDCPPGMRMLDEDERLEMLNSLDETEAEVRRMLVRIPLQVDTPSMIRRREALERRLGEIARNRMLFAKPRVYIKADEQQG